MSEELLRCPHCEVDVPPGVDWCPNCNAYLAWEAGPDGVRAEAASSAAATTAMTAVAAGGPSQTGASATLAPRAIALEVRLAGSLEPAAHLDVHVPAGGSQALVAVVRNQSGLVGGYRVGITGLPTGWWTAEPAVVHLMPLGSGDPYEAEVVITLHPPRNPGAVAGPRHFRVAAVPIDAPSADLAATASTYALRDRVAARRQAMRAEARVPGTLTVGPFADLAVAVSPQVASGRRVGHFTALVTNRGNATTAVVVRAADDEERLRIVAPVFLAGVEPGTTARIPVTVRPRRPRPVGPPAVHQLRFWAAPPETAAQGATHAARATFRQRALIPWWAILVALLLVLIGVLLLILLRTDTVRVPDVRGSPSVYAARVQLEQDGLTASQAADSVVRARVPPGTVIEQTPDPGAEVKRGQAVTLLVTKGRRTVRVPRVRGMFPAQADHMLTRHHLTLGAVSPSLEPGRRIATQVPVAGQRRRRGTPVNVVLANVRVPVPDLAGLTPAAAEQHLAKGGLALGQMFPRPMAKGTVRAQVPEADVQRVTGSKVDVFLRPPPPQNKKKKKSESGGGSSSSGKPATDPPVPRTAGTAIASAAAAIRGRGLRPRRVTVIDPAPRGTVLRSNPVAGRGLAKGARVTLIVSAGFPRLAFATAAGPVAVDGSSGARRRWLSRRADAGDGAPAWTPDARAVLFASGGRIVLAHAAWPHRPATLALHKAGDDLDAPAVGAAPGRTVVAFVSHAPAKGDRLCWTTLVGRRVGRLSCRRAPGWRLGALSWAPRGRALLAAAQPFDGRAAPFGELRFTAPVAFSARARDWAGGRRIATPGGGDRGVRGAAYSPDGRRLALVVGSAGRGFRIAIAAVGDLALRHARMLPLAGCAVAWRPDGRELAVLQADAACERAEGTVVRVAPDHPRRLSTVVVRATAPAWQPVRPR